MDFKPTIIQPWIFQTNYQGSDYRGFYVAAMRGFRCTLRERQDFQYVREQLEGLVSPDVITVTFGDECLIARYAVLVHKDFEAGLKMADMFAKRLAKKGYIDPESRSIDDFDARDHHVERLPVQEAVSKAPELTGRYFAVPMHPGQPGGQMTTYTLQQKRFVVQEEAAKRKRLLAELAIVAGGPVPSVARSLDGIQRRWKGIKGGGSDSYDKPEMSEV
jgi:hypothetical protein